MRNLNHMELDHVSGGDWSFEIDLGVTKFEVSGSETVQDMAAGIGDLLGGAYDASRDGWTDLFTWWDPAGYYNMGCAGGGGR